MFFQWLVYIFLFFVFSCFAFVLADAWPGSSAEPRRNVTAQKDPAAPARSQKSDKRSEKNPSGTQGSE